MYDYYKPASSSRGTKYHIVKHTGDRLIPTTEEEIRDSNLEPCKICMNHHSMIPVDQT